MWKADNHQTSRSLCQTYPGILSLLLLNISHLTEHSYHLIVERDRTHLRTKFVFDEKHDIKFCKPVERMGKQVSEGEVQKLLAKAGDGTS